MKKYTLTRLFIVNILSFTLLNIYHTGLPLIGKTYLGLTNSQIGLYIALSIISSMAIRLSIGKFIDKKGTKITVWAGSVLGAAGMLLFSVALSRIFYLIGSILLGLGSFLVIISTLITLSKAFEKERYISVFGRFGVSFYIPVFYAPAFVLLLYKTNFRLPMLVGVILYFIVPVIFPYLEGNGTAAAEIERIQKGYFKITLPVLLILPITIFDAAIWTFFVIYLLSIMREGIAVSLGSKFFITLSIIVIITKIWLSQHKKKISLRQMYVQVLYGFVLLLFSALLLVLKWHWLLLILPLFYGVGFAISDVFLITMSIKSYPTDFEGLALALYSIFFDLGWLIGAYGLGLVADHYGYIAIYKICALFIGLAVLGVAFNLLFLLRE